MKKEDKTNKLEVEDFELLRAGINDSANLLADDELSELFGGYRSCQPGYCEKNFKNGISLSNRLKDWCIYEILDL